MRCATPYPEHARNYMDQEPKRPSPRETSVSRNDNSGLSAVVEYRGLRGGIGDRGGIIPPRYCQETP